MAREKRRLYRYADADSYEAAAAEFEARIRELEDANSAKSERLLAAAGEIIELRQLLVRRERKIASLDREIARLWKLVNAAEAARNG